MPLYRQLAPRAWRDGRLYGELRVKDQETAEFLKVLLSDELENDYSCYIEEGDPDNITIGDTFRLGFARIRPAIGLLIPDVSELLANSKLVSDAAFAPWYVVAEDEASWEHGPISQRLSAINQLVAALEGAVSVIDHRKGTLVFIRDGRFDVPLRLDGETFRTFDLDVLRQLVGLLKLEDGHTKQRHEICATAIREMLVNTPVEHRFGRLLLDIAELKQRLIDGYALFASAFSFKKVRDQAEAMRIEYTGKIHKTFSDIQGQLLGIPVSAFVVATQFKDAATAPAGQVWVNLGIFVGVLIFCILFSLSALNQWHTLDVLEDEIKRQERTLLEEHADLKSRLDDIFTKLHDRSLAHRVALIIVIAVCWTGFLLSTGAFWHLTRSAF